MKILHLITSLDTGGAETALHRLVAETGARHPQVESRVVCMLPPGPVGARIRACGVSVEHLGMRRGAPSPAAVWRLVRMLRAFRPDVVQTWLYHADFLGLVAAKLAGVRTVAWNLRCSRMDLEHYGRLTRIVRALCARLAGSAAAVVANSRAAVAYHRELGYAPKRFEIIPNGYDADLFRPDPAARAALRARLGVGTGKVLVGLAGRWDHMKGHALFCRAAGRAYAQNPALRFVLCGDGIDGANEELAGHLAGAGIADAAHLLGRVDEMAGFYPGLDILCLSSLGESFPNVVAEAMACGVPCVATDVGDAADIVGRAGTVVPAEDAAALAGALADMAGLEPGARGALGAAARERVVERYSLAAMAGRYVQLYQSLAGGA